MTDSRRRLIIPIPLVQETKRNHESARNATGLTSPLYIHHKPCPGHVWQEPCSQRETWTATKPRFYLHLNAAGARRESTQLTQSLINKPHHGLFFPSPFRISIQFASQHSNVKHSETADTQITTTAGWTGRMGWETGRGVSRCFSFVLCECRKGKSVELHWLDGNDCVWRTIPYTSSYPRSSPLA